jgi:hypothetical protein
MTKSLFRLRWDQSSKLAFEPDILASHQYLANHRRSDPAEPERALIFAVLAEAVETYQKFAFSNSGRGRALFREAQAWLWDDETDGLFSFLNICAMFGLDPASLRRGLSRWRANRCNLSPQPRIQLRSGRSRARKPISMLANELGSNHLRLRCLAAPLNQLMSRCPARPR